MSQTCAVATHSLWPIVGIAHIIATAMPYSRTDQGYLLRFGNTVRALRTARGWSQEELAGECELHRTYIGAIETGKRNVSLLNLRVLATALRVNYDELLPPPW